MLYTILTIERNDTKSRIKVNDALGVMRLCMDIFDIREGLNPFTTHCTSGRFIMQIDDYYPYFVELVDVFTAQMNYNKVRHNYGNKRK